jgi:hypothetical protein
MGKSLLRSRSKVKRIAQGWRVGLMRGYVVSGSFFSIERLLVHELSFCLWRASGRSMLLRIVYASQTLFWISSASRLHPGRLLEPREPHQIQSGNLRFTLTIGPGAGPSGADQSRHVESRCISRLRQSRSDSVRSAARTSVRGLDLHNHKHYRFAGLLLLPWLLLSRRGLAAIITISILLVSIRIPSTRIRT